MHKDTPYLNKILAKYDNNYFQFKKDNQDILSYNQNTPYINNVLKKFLTHYEKQDQQDEMGKNNKIQIKSQNYKSDKAIKLKRELEKKLNDIQANSLGSIGETKANFLNKQVDSKNQQLNYGIENQYLSTKMCRNNENCPFAHSKEQLDIEYLPGCNFKQQQFYIQKTDLIYYKKIKEWVKYFKELSDNNKNIRRAQSSMALKRTMFITNRSKLSDNLKQASNQQFYSIDKIIDKKGSTLLIQSVLQCNYQAVQQLLLMGADPTINDWSGCDSIMYAIKKNFYSIMTLLLDLSQKQINFDKRFFSLKITYLIQAAKLGQSDMVVALLASGADPNVTDFHKKSAIFHSIELNDLDSIYSLVENGADCKFVDDKNKTSVDYAFQKKHIHIIQYLFLKKGQLADESHYIDVLFFAASNNQFELIKEITSRGFPPGSTDEDGNTILLLAFKNQHFNLVLQLIQQLQLNWLISHQNKNGDNLITLSIRQGVKNLAKIFIQECSAVELNKVDKDGKTPLIHAAEQGYHEIIESLMKKGVDFSRADKHNRTPLIYAVKNKHLLCVETIFQQSLQLNDVDKKNRKQVQSALSKQPELIQQKFDEEMKNKESKLKDMIHWKDQFDMGARQYAENPSTIRDLIGQYIIDLDCMSDSFIKEQQDEQKK
ncbi:Ankyrin repeat-containing domain [Pseudocohnilembus persalinus]|uniref:Ankyrin repeat-containing domain n=1 Tax=Pseudocohnilembus persalinus TaxID=266149 RepID=A0A0V0QI30_PSEPJ|nr:Ankyrin repeat-containing domain [Pseudocohnilembus persalinus]|eukprot:KRX01863.1 Ankyrin repeat-containing domain [Pseudocohnilembus persalinus]